MDCSHGNCTVVLPGPSLASCGRSTLSLFMLVLEQFLRTQCDIEDPCDQIRPTADPLPQYDFIVVGAGSAGCVVASRLSEVADWKVLLVEAGVNEPTFSQVPSLYECAQNSSVDWRYFTEPEPTACLISGGSCYWPRGKVVGGSSVLNKLYYVRGNRKDYDDWEKMGNTGWSYKDVLPYFLKSENSLLTDQVDQEFHGKGGYLPVSQFPFSYPIEEDILKAAVELGFEIGDYNGERQTRFSPAQTTSKNGIRFSTSRAFLRPVQRRPNLHILLNTFVTRVLVRPETKQAYGVEIITSQGDKQTISATKEVIVSAGAINSPQILLLSGIGDKTELEKVNVPVVHDLPGVGRNLLNHISFGVKFVINDTDLNCLTWASATEYLLFRTGPMSTSNPNVLGFIQTKFTNSSEDYPDVEIQFTGYSASYSKTGVIGELNGNCVNGSVPKRIVNFLPTLLRTESKGYLTLRDNNPLSYPKLFPMYLTDPLDLARLIEGIKFSLRIAQTNALQKYGFEVDRTPVTGCEDIPFGSDEYWECAIRTNPYPENHQSGSCKMGPDSDPGAVVDPQLRVRGVGCLRVVDASIMPVVPLANINAPTIMIAEKASDMIKKSWPLYPNNSRINNMRKRFNEAKHERFS